jgi:hypothetical protein
MVQAAALAHGIVDPATNQSRIGVKRKTYTQCEFFDPAPAAPFDHSFVLLSPSQTSGNSVAKLRFSAAC